MTTQEIEARLTRLEKLVEYQIKEHYCNYGRSGSGPISCDCGFFDAAWEAGFSKEVEEATGMKSGHTLSVSIKV